MRVFLVAGSGKGAFRISRPDDVCELASRVGFTPPSQHNLVARHESKFDMSSKLKNQQATVLIIDDDEQIRNLLVDGLGDHYSCRAVGSAEEELATLSADAFDLVISDIDMVGMSGIELVGRLHSLFPDTVVVMISGQQSIQTAIEAMRVGAFDYVTKPLDLRHVEAAVERALAYAISSKKNSSTKRSSSICWKNEVLRLIV
jgi:Response regulator containing CheY-like receiver, AAA-type ATPase, and DNA-binding domains